MNEQQPLLTEPMYVNPFNLLEANPVSQVKKGVKRPFFKLPTLLDRAESIKLSTKPELTGRLCAN